MAAKAKTVKVIDAHGHPDWHGHNFDEFIGNMDRCGIVRTWLLSWEAPEDECDPAFDHVLGARLFGATTGPIPFSRCLAYKERAPERFVLGYAPDPRRRDAIARMRAAVDTYGVRVCGELKVRMMYDNPDALRLFRLCGERSVPVTVHIDYEFDAPAAYPRPNYWYGGGMEAFERAVAKCAGTLFLGHGPGFWAHISGDDKYDKEVYPRGRVKAGGKLPAMLRRHANLYCDISAGSGLNALKRDSKFAGKFIVEFQDRVVYGRDCFDNGHQEFLNSLDLPGAVIDKIFSGNAARLVPEIPGVRQPELE